MKNVYILPTNKPSNLYQIGNDLIKSIISSHHLNNIGRHIYMTSNDVKLIGDYICDLVTKEVSKVTEETLSTASHPSYEKIILTTDQDLINDGIEPIDDAFIKFIVNHLKQSNGQIINPQSINKTFTTEQAFNLFKKGMEWMEKQIESDGKYGENYSFEQCFNDNIK